MWPLSLINTVQRSIIHLQCFEMVSKKTRSSVTGKMDDRIPLSSSDYTMTSKKKKNLLAMFKIQMKKNCLSLKTRDDALFKVKSKIPTFVLKPIKAIRKFLVDIISLQQLGYEMERSDLPDDYFFFEIGYCGHPAFPYVHI